MKMQLKKWKGLIKAIIFDLDDTLYEERTFIEGGFKAVSRYMERQFSIDNKEFFKVLMNTLEEGRGHNFDIALTNYNLHNEKLLQKLVKIYRNHKPRIKPYPGVVNTLLILRNNKFFLGLITDGSESVQRNKITSLGIERLFDAIIYTDRIGKDVSKPSKRAYEMILEQFDIVAKEAIYVGDNPYKDFIGAKRLGMKTVRILQGEYKNGKVSKNYEANSFIKEVSELLSLISK